LLYYYFISNVILEGYENNFLKICCFLVEGTKTIVFVELKRTADFIAAFLSETQIGSTSIHGDRLQAERETALRDFRNGKFNILVATSVAARGLGKIDVTIPYFPF